MTGEAVITTRRLMKKYGTVTAVDGLDLEVRKGEIYAFLGRNGAGKTTTIRMILGLIQPLSGEVRVFGQPVVAHGREPDRFSPTFCLVAAISYLLAPTVALVTVWTRGYLAPVGFALGVLLFGNVVGHTGWAPWFPWSIVPILVGSVSAPVDQLPMGSLVVLAGTFATGIAATVWRLQTADNTQ